MATCFQRRPDLAARDVAGETLLLDNVGELVHQLNATASFIWSCLDGRTSGHQIVQRLTEHYDVDPEIAARDVCAVI
ncbi:MAG: PqqD family protein, partial [Planctomycetales bacterium]|nr:PqqD family protein [Planctomycetales bacterium]